MPNPDTNASILIIDDDDEIRYSLGRVLSSGNFTISEAASGEAGVAAVKKGPFPDLIFLDIRMGGMSGIEALQHIRGANPKQLVVLMTAFGTAQTAIEAMKFGAFDYIMKPFDPAKVRSLADKALKAHAEMQAVGDYKPTINSEDYKEGIVGSSSAMQEVFKVIGQVTASDVTVMITGESGTGKELVARALHFNGPRRKARFVSENCAAIPANLMESEFFGHVKGAFTGASSDKMGLFEAADGGTLFLDEIGDMDLDMQTKLLRVLQDGVLRRVGSKEFKRVNVRIVSATNKDLLSFIKEGRFREDLYYRLNVINILLPPLRERREDIPLLAEHFLKQQDRQSGSGAAPRTLSDEALDLFLRYSWPGNIRELENEIMRSSALCKDLIGPEYLSKNLIDGARQPLNDAPKNAKVRGLLLAGKTLKELVADEVDALEVTAISEVLRRSGYKKSKAARVLGISRPTLDAKIEKHGLTREQVLEES